MLPSISYLIKNSAGAHKEPRKKYKNNLRTLKSKSYQQCRTKHEFIINKELHFLPAELRDSADLIKVLNMSKTTLAFTSSTRFNYLSVCALPLKFEFLDLKEWFKCSPGVFF